MRAHKCIDAREVVVSSAMLSEGSGVSAEARDRFCGVSRHGGAFFSLLCRRQPDQTMQPLTVVSEIDQLPLTFNFLMPAQHEPREAEHVFDNPEHRLHRLLAQPVLLPPRFAVELRLHRLGPGTSRSTRALVFLRGTKSHSDVGAPRPPSTPAPRYDCLERPRPQLARPQPGSHSRCQPPPCAGDPAHRVSLRYRPPARWRHWRIDSLEPPTPADSPRRPPPIARCSSGDTHGAWIYASTRCQGQSDSSAPHPRGCHRAALSFLPLRFPGRPSRCDTLRSYSARSLSARTLACLSKRLHAASSCSASFSRRANPSGSD